MKHFIQPQYRILSYFRKQDFFFLKQSSVPASPPHSLGLNFHGNQAASIDCILPQAERDYLEY